MEIIVRYEGALDAGDSRHAQEIMKDLGIEYTSVIPETIASAWIFEGVKESSVPDNLPSYVEILRR